MIGRMGKAIAIITARGGSKRIPRKNVKEFCGEPIMLYSIKAALESGIFDEVMVSTDDEEIAGLAIQAGATVPFMRSRKASDDYATTADVLLEVLREYKKRGFLFTCACCIYPTAPFVTGDKIRRAYALLADSGADMVMPVVKYSFPPQRGLRKEGDRLVYWFPEHENTRSQDLEDIYHDAGQFYFYRLKENNQFRCNERVPFFVSGMEVQDIDNESDWEIAEMKFERMRVRTKYCTKQKEF